MRMKLLLLLFTASASCFGQLALAGNVGQTFEASTTTYNVLHNFSGQPDGKLSYASLAEDAAGNLFGTTFQGGVSNFGTVFEVSRKSVETVLYSFTGGTDGSNPNAAVILDSSGNLYGTTTYGGAYGFGTLFKVSARGEETVLYAFTGGTDGANPYAALVRDTKGNLYGTTLYGGGVVNSSCPDGCGTVFEVNSVGKEIVLHSFAATAEDGYYPFAGLVRDSAGNLYGTTIYGGAYGWGTVFTVSSKGKFSIRYSFIGGDAGAYPYAGLVRDTKGNLYGATVAGGASDDGTLFKVSETGSETVLYSFTGGTDGGGPYSGLVRDAAGNLYGTTLGGGSGFGTAYELEVSGQETVLHSFTSEDGEYPAAGLLRDAKGSLYGTTESGGASGYGTVFKLTL